MWKKIAIASGIGAAVVGGTTAALAAANDSGTPATSASASASAPAAAKGAHGGRLAGLLARRFEHGEWVSKGESGTETHDAIRGTVSAVSPTSVSVKADDGYSLTFIVDSNTKVLLRENGKGSAKKGAIGDVKDGDHVLVAGVKSGSTVTANHVVDTGTK